MLLAVTQGELAERVVTVSLAMGIAAFLTGVVLMVIDWLSERELRKATRQAGQQLGVASAQGQGLAIPGVGEAVNALANLAKALKELDRSTRLLLAAMVFLAIAAVGALVKP